MTPIPFTRGVPPEQVLPVTELVKLTTEVLSERPVELFQYPRIGANLGDDALRAALAGRLGTTPERVFVGNGSLQVLDLLAAALLSGENKSVVVEEPTYDRARQIFERHGGQVTGVPLRSTGFAVDALADVVARVRPAFVYTIPDFQNPSGVCAGVEQRQALVDLAERHGFAIVEDTPYRALRYHGVELPSIADLAPERVITVGSLSKVLSPGLRVGYAVGTPELVAGIAVRAEGTYLTPTPLTQAVAARALEYGVVDSAIADAVAFLKPRHDSAVAAARAAFGDALLAEPGGGYFLSVLAESRLTEAELVAGAKAAGVTFAPGSAFFPGGRLPDGKLFLRLPFQALPESDFARGARALADVLVGR
ncbi:aminotransferase-like domain-containing protein [Actinokineospora diospyrosa]|uniref:2-aminoadipate transaminase n=1 Tax=Actinokineospora diospyrosa TaxID=103728 RepID=A0ABT1IBY9_9PSEU|nr:PLP-dependent aminotransferase family protein [Actinokineospora diospyrosa]MCP2270148.1 2-aminoadipate transaminase [Actinokineospora diospyrosa]